MTKEQWEAVENKLYSTYGDVRLKIDGYDVSIRTERNKMKLVFAVYVDGKIKSEWILNDCEIRRKFYCKSTKCAVHVDYKKLGKASKAVKKEVEEYRKQNTFSYYLPYFKSFRTLKRTLLANNTEIKLMEEFL